MPHLTHACGALVALVALEGCFDEVRCADDALCPESVPFCVEGVCQARSGDEGEGEAGEGEGEAGEGEGEPGEGEGEPGEGEGEGEGEPPLDCREAGCPPDLGCVDEGSVDIGLCVPPPETPDDCAAASQFFARAAQAPYVWRPIHVVTLEPPSAAAYGCSGTDRAVQFNFQFLDDEDDAGHRDAPVQVRSQNGTTTPPPENFAHAFSGRDGHVGSMTVAVCLAPNVSEFAFAFDDDDGRTSNAACIVIP